MKATITNRQINECNPESVNRVDFDSVKVHYSDGVTKKRRITIEVRGIKPLNTEIKLLPIFNQSPNMEWWPIEIVGWMTGYNIFPTLEPFAISIDLTGISGTKGIEVIGCTKKQTVEIDQDS